MSDISEMNLSCTVSGMISDDYAERFRAEYMQAYIRLMKLRVMLKSWHRGELKFKPKCDLRYYEAQEQALAEYVVTLVNRAHAEGIAIDMDMQLG